MIPVFVICRDRVSCLEKLVDHLETVENIDVILVDNDSTYEPMLDYLKHTPHQVIQLGYNGGHHGPWDQDILPKNTYFGVTDPDVVPVDDVPKNYPEFMIDFLRVNPTLIKAGFSLRLDNLPDHYRFKDEVIKWEHQFWRRTYGHNGEVRMFDAPIDTTFAFYNPNRSWDLAPSVRADYPYVAEHLPWYVDSDNPSEEDVYYKEHANRIVTTWLYDDMSEAIRASVQ